MTADSESFPWSIEDGTIFSDESPEELTLADVRMAFITGLELRRHRNIRIGRPQDIPESLRKPTQSE